jgi:hypothetical protein
MAVPAIIRNTKNEARSERRGNFHNVIIEIFAVSQNAQPPSFRFPSGVEIEEYGD